MIQKRFGLDIPVFVILQEKLEDILRIQVSTSKVSM